MKHRFLDRLICINMFLVSVVTFIPEKSSAQWINNYNGVWSYIEGYNYATGWKAIDGKWYYFDNYGQMLTGWIQNGDDWYYMALDGAMQTGVIQIEGKIYLFSDDGKMQRGQCLINGIFYQFNNNGIYVGNNPPMPSRAFDYYGNSTVIYAPSLIVDDDDSMSSDIPVDETKKTTTQYKIKFKDPDADDDDKELLKTKTVDEDTIINLYKPSKSGYKFIEWNTKSDGDGISYDYDDTLKVTKNITLYAQWKEESSDDDDDDDDIQVKAITVYGTNSATEITTKGGSLQMLKKIAPNDATNQSVTWLVADKTGSATISSTGKLTAVSDGTVVVRATAKDGSGIYGEVTITISNQ